MTQWISTTQEDYMTKSAALKGDVKIEWSEKYQQMKHFILKY